jgi:hypothetical protein
LSKNARLGSTATGVATATAAATVTRLVPLAAAATARSQATATIYEFPQWVSATDLQLRSATASVDPSTASANIFIESVLTTVVSGNVTATAVPAVVYLTIQVFYPDSEVTVFSIGAEVDTQYVAAA